MKNKDLKLLTRQFLKLSIKKNTKNYTKNLHLLKKINKKISLILLLNQSKQINRDISYIS
jgi:hypothetical protein